MPEFLWVVLDGLTVGRLIPEGRGVRFAYDEDWLDRPAPSPLSLSMPPREEPYDAEAEAFFAGLLPEGAVREHLARRLGISADNDYALLAAIGGDCAGAVSLLAPDAPPPDPAGPQRYRYLSDAELAAELVELPTRPLGVDPEGGIRLSLAGAQDKLVVYVAPDGRIGLPLGAGSPSTHIVKVTIPGVADTILNEAFCLDLARAAGLEAAIAEPRSAAGTEYLLVSRYDRRAVGERVGRVHQEDVAQALGIPPERKYETEGGPSTADVFGLLRKASRRPAVNILRYHDALVFNWLIGNHDAHAKNYSVLLDDEGPRLAPLYDLLCTACYTGLSRRSAQRIGGQDRADHVAERHWEHMALEAGLGAAAARRRRRTLGLRTAELAPGLVERYREAGRDGPVLTPVARTVARRASRLAEP